MVARFDVYLVNLDAEPIVVLVDLHADRAGAPSEFRAWLYATSPMVFTVRRTGRHSRVMASYSASS